MFANLAFVVRRRGRSIDHLPNPFLKFYRCERAIVGSAVYNGVFVFRVNRVEGEDGLPFYGKSFCVDPNGDFVVEPSGGSEGVILAEIDLRWVKAVRGIWPFLQDRRPEIYAELV